MYQNRQIIDPRCIPETTSEIWVQFPAAVLLPLPNQTQRDVSVDGKLVRDHVFVRADSLVFSVFLPHTLAN